MQNTLRASAFYCAMACLALILSVSPAHARNDNSDVVRAAQIRLTDLGFPVGHVDGVMGRQTEKAIMAFQRQNALIVTGRLTPETFSLLASSRGVGRGTATYATYEDYFPNHAYIIRTNNSSFSEGPVVVDAPWYSREYR
jgi:peptidoglycan hydrolase-like protein with peptidoglycan-binding domain